MSQLTLRIPDQLARQLRAAATARGRSVNGWATAVLAAAVDPRFAGDEAAALRERLERAGLLVSPVSGVRKKPGRVALARARAAAGKGRALSSLVSEGRR